MLTCGSTKFLILLVLEEKLVVPRVGGGLLPLSASNRAQAFRNCVENNGLRIALLAEASPAHRFNAALFVTEENPIRIED